MIGTIRATSAVALSQRRAGLQPGNGLKPKPRRCSSAAIEAQRNDHVDVGDP